MNVFVKLEDLIIVVLVGVFVEEVKIVQYYIDWLFCFCMMWLVSFWFCLGEFVMIGLMIDGKLIYWVYFIVSFVWDEELEFFFIKVLDGLLMLQLQKIQLGDVVLMKKKLIGMLVNDVLVFGKWVYMFLIGIGIVLFVSLIWDFDIYEKFDQVILMYICWEVVELKYGQDFVEEMLNDLLIGEFVKDKLLYYMFVICEDFLCKGCIIDLIKFGKLFEDFGVLLFDLVIDWGMICGLMDMLCDIKVFLEEVGFIEGVNNKLVEFVVECVFVG